MQKFKPFGDIVLVEKIVVDSNLYTAEVKQTDGRVLISNIEGIKKDDTIHFTRIKGDVSEGVMAINKEDIIAIEN